MVCRPLRPDQGYAYLKRFMMEATDKKNNFLSENEASHLFLLSDQPYLKIRVTFGGHDDFREPIEIDAEEFIAVKGVKAKGKRISNYEVKNIEELEPTRFSESESSSEDESEIEFRTDHSDIRDSSFDEINGQMNLFD